MTGPGGGLYDDPAFFGRYQQMRHRGAETSALAAESPDLVVSSLALHYVAGYDALIQRITCCSGLPFTRPRPGELASSPGVGQPA